MVVSVVSNCPYVVRRRGRGSTQDQGSEGEGVPVALCPQLAGSRLNVIVLDEAIIILDLTHLWAAVPPCPGQRAVLVAGTVAAAQVAFGSNCDEHREDHGPQHNPYQHRPCPAPRAWSGSCG